MRPHGARYVGRNSHWRLEEFPQFRERRVPGNRNFLLVLRFATNTVLGHRARSRHPKNRGVSPTFDKHVFGARVASLRPCPYGVSSFNRRRKKKNNINNKKEVKILFFIFFYFCLQRQHIPSGLGWFEKGRGRPMAGRRGKGADVSDERPECWRLSQLHQSTFVDRETAVRMRYRSLFTTVHVERGKAFDNGLMYRLLTSKRIIISNPKSIEFQKCLRRLLNTISLYVL